MVGTNETHLQPIKDNDIVINRPKKGEFYILRVDVDCPEHGVVFENKRHVVTPPDRLHQPNGAAFRLFNEMPRLRQSRPDCMVNDLASSFGGYWLVSEPLKRVFESVDPEGFAFAECEFILHDGTVGPKHYLCDVVRILDAVDETTSKIRIELDDDFPGGKYYSEGSAARFAFKKDVVGSAHVFLTPYNSMKVFCDRTLRDALIEHGFGKEPNTRGVLLEDAAALGLYTLPPSYWPENR
ncbi:DUF1629 domain-containing protein [Stenotrophomonas sp. C3(2023)]|uniref:imm11 family protein n=1 Tax=Stenotrophomonas sp. C3(2023) TaxID=3080277 RepID=UPI00293CC923|nr:DUF1629 domain-containing protein [Stenotrophomonas sp. C3(2023)]MDV3467260.1 DUF1629 domain-containing protein [Stenotrophomonas sp. C3(2023)]